MDTLMTETPFWTPSQPPAAKEPPPTNGAGSDELARSATSEVANVAPDSILQLGLAFWGSKTLLSAVELGVFTELAHRPLKAQILIERLRLHQRGARDFLDALVALGMLDRDGDIYRNTPATALFLDRNKPSYVGGLLEMANARLYPFWGNLTEALRSGEPQNELKRGENFFEKVYSEPQRLAGFLQAMTGISMGAARAMAEKFPWSDYKSFADLGCAQGALPVQVAICASAPEGHWLRSSAGSAPLRILCGRARSFSPAVISGRRFLRRPAAAGGGLCHGPRHPRLESGGEETIDPQGLRSPAQGRRADRL
jgi:hypothetical protein